MTWADQGGIAFAKSSDKGLQWTIGYTPGTSVSGSTSDDFWNFTLIAVDRHGVLYVTWSQMVGKLPSPSGIRQWLGWSTDAGAHWHRMILPTRRGAAFPALALIGPDTSASAGWTPIKQENRTPAASEALLAPRGGRRHQPPRSPQAAARHGRRERPRQPLGGATTETVRRLSTWVTTSDEVL
jgi:hypothetical protein